MMKPPILLLTLLFLFTMTSSLQCDKCTTGTLKLDRTRSWLPLKGQTKLRFVDNNGTSREFRLNVVDTTETTENDCGGRYDFQYINADLFLNQGSTDSIHFGLSANGWLCMHAWSGNGFSLNMCNVFGQTEQGEIAKRFINYTVGGRTYLEAILLLSGPGYSAGIDSVVIANSVGIVGFKYGELTYSLE